MSTPHNGRDSFRKLHFESLAACRGELQRVLEADAEGKLQAVGKWTPGRILAHIAAWIEYGYEGYPLKKFPFFVQWLLGFQLKQIFRKGMSPGVRIPGVQGGTTGAEDTAIAAAGERHMRYPRKYLATYLSGPGGAAMQNACIRLHLSTYIPCAATEN